MKANTVIILSRRIASPTPSMECTDGDACCHDGLEIIPKRRGIRLLSAVRHCTLCTPVLILASVPRLQRRLCTCAPDVIRTASKYYKLVLQGALSLQYYIALSSSPQLALFRDWLLGGERKSINCALRFKTIAPCSSLRHIASS